MPEEGIKYVQRQELMSYEEMLRLVSVLTEMGINKLRITGGEPFVRKDMLDLLWQFSRLDKLKQIHLTTNGTLTEDLVPELKKMGIRSVNLSLDTLDRSRFFEITRRDSFDQVMKTYDQLLRFDIPTKINMVVMAEKNIQDLKTMSELTKNDPVTVRFIEEMPFNGEGDHYQKWEWNHRRILEELRTFYPNILQLPTPPHSTASLYQVPGYKGQLGIIAAYSRTFCGSCNRIRITPKGLLKTCLYDSGVFNIKDLMRAGATDEQVSQSFLDALGHRAKDGFEAEKSRLGLPVKESMSTIGG